MFCKKCGKEIEDESIFCTYCGKNVTKKLEDSEKVFQKTNEDNQIRNDDLNEKDKPVYKKPVFIIFGSLILISILFSITEKNPISSFFTSMFALLILFFLVFIIISIFSPAKGLYYIPALKNRKRSEAILINLAGVIFSMILFALTNPGTHESDNSVKTANVLDNRLKKSNNPNKQNNSTKPTTPPNKFQDFFNKGLESSNNKDWDGAITYYTQALSLKTDVNIYYNRGSAYLNKAQYDNAIADYNKVISGNIESPFNAYVYRNRGVCYQNKGDKDKANSDFEKACELGDSDACSLITVSKPTPSPTPKVEYVSISYFTIRKNMNKMTDAQFKKFTSGLIGKRVKWSGYVDEVKKSWLTEEYEIWLDMDSPGSISVQDLYFSVPEKIAMKLNKNAYITFTGTIESIMDVLTVCTVHLKDAKVYSY